MRVTRGVTRANALWVAAIFLTLVVGCQQDGIGYRHRPLVVPDKVTNILEYSPPSDWQQIDAEGKFSFAIPPSMAKTDGIGIDSYVEEYVGENIGILFDYSESIARHDVGRNLTRTTEWVLVDGRKAEIVTMDSVSTKSGRQKHVVMLVPRISKVKEASVVLRGTCKDLKGQALIRQILGTVHFPKN